MLDWDSSSPVHFRSVVESWKRGWCFLGEFSNQTSKLCRTNFRFTAHVGSVNASSHTKFFVCNHPSSPIQKCQSFRALSGSSLHQCRLSRREKRRIPVQD